MITETRPTVSPFRHHWQLDPAIDLLNHGSFGATPVSVLKEQRRLQDALEREPLRFLAQERELEPKLDAVRAKVAALVEAPADSIVFVRNATDAVNAVLRSMKFEHQDEIVITDHGYNACNNVAKYVADRAGGQVRVAKIPFPCEGDDEVVEAITAQFTDRTRVLLVDHVTSSTALILPVQRLVSEARRRGIRTLIDGAHAPGMIPVDLSSIEPDYYTANHHKWLCAPKTSGFLYVREELQPEVRPTVISHAENTDRPNRSKFLSRFDWVGTYDPTPVLRTTTSVEFLETLRPGGLQAHRAANHDLALRARRMVLESMNMSEPAPESMIGSMATIPLPVQEVTEATGPIHPLQRRLFEEHRIEVPVFVGPGQRPMLRFSAQAYNDIDQYERLAVNLKRFLLDGQ